MDSFSVSNHFRGISVYLLKNVAFTKLLKRFDFGVYAYQQITTLNPNDQYAKNKAAGALDCGVN